MCKLCLFCVFLKKQSEMAIAFSFECLCVCVCVCVCVCASKSVTPWACISTGRNLLVQFPYKNYLNAFAKE